MDDATDWSSSGRFLQVLVAVALQGAGLLQVTSDLSQVLDLGLQSLDLKERRRFISAVLDLIPSVRLGSSSQNQAELGAQSPILTGSTAAPLQPDIL